MSNKGLICCSPPKRANAKHRRRHSEWDHRIALTKGKETELLLVLDYPETPLHNNTAEITVREEVIKRKISYGSSCEDGRTAWENMLSIRAGNRASVSTNMHEIYSQTSIRCRDCPNLLLMVGQRVVSRTEESWFTTSY